jgi:hypothetical protein
VSRQSNIQSPNPTRKITLYEFDFTTSISYSVGPGPDILRITNEREDVTFDGDVYTKESLRFIPSAVESGGKLPQARLQVWGQQSEFRSALLEYKEINKTTLKKITVFQSDLATPAEAKTSYWRIDEDQRDPEVFNFILTKSDGLERPFDNFLRGLVKRAWNV